MNTSLLFSLLILFSFSCFPNLTTSTSRILALVEPNPIILKYHNGDLLKGNITVNLIWYGKFTATQKSIIVDFLNSFNRRVPLPLSVASWWSTTSKYRGGQRSIFVNKQITDQTYSLGKSLKNDQIMSLATKYGYGPNSINVVLTSADVAVEGFCMNRCGTHGNIKKSGKEAIYVWVGNSATQCPGQCAWPFAKPTFGPQTKPLVAPNKDVGIDGMIINLATLLAGTVTNPSDGGYYQGPATAPLEAVSACTGIFGSGAFPGYPGKVLVDKVSGGTYNARGGKGKYLLPAMWDPTTSKCKPIV